MAICSICWWWYTLNTIIFCYLNQFHATTFLTPASTIKPLNDCHRTVIAILLHTAHACVPFKVSSGRNALLLTCATGLRCAVPQRGMLWPVREVAAGPHASFPASYSARMAGLSKKTWRSRNRAISLPTRKDFGRDWTHTLFYKVNWATIGKGHV